MPHINADRLTAAAHSEARADTDHPSHLSFEKHVDAAGYDADDERETRKPSRTSGAGTSSTELKNAYDHVTGFHLTSSANKASIQQAGFDTSKKSGNSALVGLPGDTQAANECASNHYVSMPSLSHAAGSSAQERRTAMQLPMVVMEAHKIANPSVVRTMVPRTDLKDDTFFPGSPQRAYMMPNQPADRVLQSHGSPSDGNVRAFAQLASQHLGHDVSLDDARQGLIDHQSDSDDDPEKLRR